jgi:hypothetical protein
MHQAYRVKLLDSKTYLVECIPNHGIRQKTKAPTVLPNLISGTEHLRQKVKINRVLESSNQLHRRHIFTCLSIILLNLIERMLLQKHIRLSSHILNLHNFTNLKRIIFMWKLLMINLKDLSEITISEFPDGFEMVIR